MATGRMLNKKICMSRQVNELSSDTCRLAFTWIIPHLDRDGRIYGDPVILRSWIFPRRTDITIDDMTCFVNEWIQAGLVVCYEVAGDDYLYFPKFRENQKKLRYDREPESCLPSPPKEITSDGIVPEECRKSAGVKPALGGTKRREEKIREDKIITATPTPPAVSGGNSVDDDKELYQSINQSFLAKQPDGKFTNYGKEGKAIKQIIAKARARSPDNVQEFCKAMLTTFYELKTGNDKFWTKQPFLPSALNTSGIWDRVLDELWQEGIAIVDDEMTREVEDIPF